MSLSLLRKHQLSSQPTAPGAPVFPSACQKCHRRPHSPGTFLSAPAPPTPVLRAATSSSFKAQLKADSPGKRPLLPGRGTHPLSSYNTAGPSHRTAHRQRAGPADSAVPHFRHVSVSHPVYPKSSFRTQRTSSCTSPPPLQWELTGFSQDASGHCLPVTWVFF